MKTNHEQNAGASWSVNLVPLPTREFILSKLDYDPNSGSIRWKRTGKEAGCKQYRRDGSPNAIRIGFSIDGELVQFVAHRLIFCIMDVAVPIGMVIDHEDRNPFNNRWKNLRLATHSDNLCNQVQVNLSKKYPELPRGVYRQSSKRSPFFAVARKGKIKIHIGSFSSIESAEAACIAARNKLHGKFSTI